MKCDLQTLIIRCALKEIVFTYLAGGLDKGSFKKHGCHENAQYTATLCIKYKNSLLHSSLDSQQLFKFSFCLSLLAGLLLLT